MYFIIQNSRSLKEALIPKPYHSLLSSAFILRQFLLLRALVQELRQVKHVAHNVALCNQALTLRGLLIDSSQILKGTFKA